MATYGLATLTIILLCILTESSQDCQDPKLLSEFLTTPFRLPNPVILKFDNNSSISWTKKIFESGSVALYDSHTIKTFNINDSQSLSFVEQRVFHQPIMACLENSSDLKMTLEFLSKFGLGKEKPIILILQTKTNLDQQEEALMKIRLDQEIFFIPLDTRELLEVYAVNNVLVKNLVGHYLDPDHGTKLVFKFESEEPWHSKLGQRRQDFHGATLVGMTDHDPPFMYLDPHCYNSAKLNEADMTYDMKDCVTGGIYFDLFTTMIRMLNFTYTMTRRDDGVWGTVIDNKPYGMLSNLADGSADVIVSALAMTLVRYPFAAYLPVVDGTTPSIFIKRDQQKEYRWLTFIKPFSLELWLVLILVAIVNATWLFLGNRALKSNVFRDVKQCLGWFWSTFSANAGGKPTLEMSKKSAMNKIVLVVVLLAGSINWMAYRAFLTSELSVSKVAYPFNNFETLLKTDFSIGTHALGTASADIFLKAKPDSTMGRVLTNNMEDRDVAFVTPSEGVKLLQSRDRYAYFEDKQVILSVVDDPCEIVSVYESTSPHFFLTFAMSRKSQFYPSMASALTKLKERGQFHFSESRYYKRDTKCKPLIDEANPLGLKTVFSLFFLVIFGIATGLFILVLEFISHHREQVLRRAKLKELLSDADTQEVLVNLGHLIEKSSDSQEKQRLLSMTIEKVFDRITSRM